MLSFLIFTGVRNQKHWCDGRLYGYSHTFFGLNTKFDPNDTIIKSTKPVEDQILPLKNVHKS